MIVVDRRPLRGTFVVETSGPMAVVGWFAVASLFVGAGAAMWWAYNDGWSPR